MSANKNRSAANNKRRDTSPSILEALASTPPFPTAEIRSALPAPLRKILEAVADKDEQAVAATAGLALLSGCLPNVKGEYDRRKYGPALFVFVVAPSGSGKGALSYARQLARGIDGYFRREYETAVEQQKADRRAREA